MTRQRNYFSLGLWVVVVAVLFFAALIFIGGRQWGQTYRSYTIRYPVTYALPDEIKPGAQVFCGASLVGRVEQIELRREESDAGQPKLWACLDVRVAEIIPLRSDCVIVARGPLLGGGGKLVIKDPGRHGAPLEEGAVITGAPSGSMEEALDALNAELDPGNPVGLLATIKSQLDPADVNSILSKIHRSLDDVNVMSRSLARQLEPTQRDALLGKLHAALDNVNATTRRLREEMQTAPDATLLAKVHAALDAVNDGLADVTGMVEENRPTIREALVTVQRTAGTIEQGIIEPIVSEVNLANTRSLLSQLHAAFDKIDAVLGDVEVIGQTARKTVVLNEDRFNQLMMNITETAAHLKGASKDLRRNPWRLFYRPSLEETKQLNIFDAAREFAEAAARLDDSATQLSALMKSSGGTVPADDPDLAEIRQRLGETFEDYTRAEEALWRQLDVR